MEKVCTCIHVLDEHEDTFMQPCTIDGCECLAFEMDREAMEE